MEDDEVVSSNSNTKPLITQAEVDDDDDEDFSILRKCEKEILKIGEIAANEGEEIVESKEVEGLGVQCKSSSLVIGEDDSKIGDIDDEVEEIRKEEEDFSILRECESSSLVSEGSDIAKEAKEIIESRIWEEKAGGGGGESDEAGEAKEGKVMMDKCDVVVVDRVVDEKVEEVDGGSVEIVDEREKKELGLESKEDLIGNAEVAGLSERGGGMMEDKCDVLAIDQVIEEKVEYEVKEEGGGGGENGSGGSGEEREGGDLGLESKELIGNDEVAGSMLLSGEANVDKCDVMVVDQVSEVAMMSSQGGDKLVFGGNDDQAVAQGDGVAETVVVGEELGEKASVELQESIGIEKNVTTEIVEMSRMETDIREDGVVEELCENASAEVQQSAVIEKNVSSEIVEMSAVETDIRGDGVIGNEDSVVSKLDDPQTDSVEMSTAGCDDAMDGVILAEQEKMVMDICVESSMRMGEGSNSEHASVVKAEKDEVKEAEMEVNLVDVDEKEKEKQVELVESDGSKYEKDGVEGGVERNDELKDAMEGNSSLGDNKLGSEKEVGINVDECIDTKEEDSESTVSESHPDKSGKDDEAEGTKEIGTGDIRMKKEADPMEITKDEEPEAAADSDAPQTPHDDEMVAEEETNPDTEVETETDVGESGKAAGGKRKRSKNKSSANPKSTAKARKTIEEDVCFICFDGGALVLCDRRGCPKAYHPSCVNRDDSFFVGKGRWNCGWHQCSICEKNANYFCYTCPYSLCKGCCKDGVLFCVRGKKGFCEICIKVVKLLENNEQGVKNDQVDFDDKGCWEFLFRDYYIELKSKLSLSSAEILEAKSPWKGLDNSAGKDDNLGTSMQENVDVKQKSLEPPSDHTDDAELDAENSNENEEAVKPRRKKVKKRPSDHTDDAELDAENSNENEKAVKPRRKKVKKRLKMRGKGQTSSRAADSISDEDHHGVTEWASKELLEFVMHMKSGDRSILSEFDVQALLLEYIKRNNLRDPRQKSRIKCDLRLQSLFGKPRVGHFEMLKLLESHFFIKEDSHTDDVQGSVVDTNSEQLEVDTNTDTPKGTKEKKRKSRKKRGRRGPQCNLDDYAAIDMHNISLIYLRRKLMEDLLEDSETFKDKIVGTFVRIRISGSAQKQDIYRLVQVVDTSNAADPYKVGKRTTNIMVEILNLNKTEVISIDTISNQDFTEDECKRLRQSIKCGLINRLTVGDILDKATELQTAKVNDWLDSEVVRLSHLRDRASDMGHKKELRECVEKLQLLKTPEERQRRLDDEIPEIHVDPKMDPTYESEEDDTHADENRQDVNTKIRSPGSRGGRGHISPGSDILSRDPWSGGVKYPNKHLELDTNNNRELDRNLSSKNLTNKSVDDTTHFGEVQGETFWNQVRDHHTKPESSSLNKFGSTLGTDTPGRNIHDEPKSESLSSSISNQAPALAKEAESTKVNESEKNWHYKDPSGKIQGPFSLVQLRKWSNTGYFPSELKIWRITEKQEDSVLLTDVLSGEFRKESAAAAITLPSTLSANLTNIMASLEHAREQQEREKKLKTDRDGSGNLLSHIVSPAVVTDPSAEHRKLSTERYSQIESSSHPSPTPVPNNAGFTRDGGPPLSSATSYFSRNGTLPSPTAVSPEYQGRSSIPTSGLRSGETSQASDNEPVGAGSNGVQVGLSVGSNTSQNSHTVVNSDSRAIQAQGNVAVAQDSFAPQIVSNQNPATGTHGWGSAQPQKADANSAILLQPQIQAYGQWGNISTATGYMHPGNFPHGNQPNMQFPAMPNPSWVVGAPDNNTTTAQAPRPENLNPNQNPNFGWGFMQGNQNTMWVGAPQVNGNVNWGVAPLSGPPPGNQIMGWTRPPANHGAAVQGQLPGGANPGWTSGTGTPPANLGAAVQGQLPGGANPGWTSGTANPPVQGLPPAGNVNQNWVASNTGNAPSNVHMPASGSGWPPSPGNLGAPIRGPVPVNGNQGLSTPPGSQGPWGTDQNHSGGKFSVQRDQSSHGGEYSYGGNRSRNRPSSFGNGGPGGPSRQQPDGRNQMPCPYNRSGRCRKGSSCNYLHT